MPLILNERALFLHVPKTGGNWCKRAFEALGIKTKQVQAEGQSNSHGIPRGIDLPIIAGVRHPIFWYESWWRYNNAKNWPIWEAGAWHPQRCLESCKSDSFIEFTQAVLREQPGYVTRMFEWYHGPPDTRGVFPIPTEYIKLQLMDALEKTGVIEGSDPPGPGDAWHKIVGIPPANVSDGPIPRWGESVKRLILLAEEPTFKRFGYDGRETG